MDDPIRTRLPLLTLEDLVCFPRTELELVVSEARDRRLVKDLLAQEGEERWLAAVLLREEPEKGFGLERSIFPDGTAARLVDSEPLNDGRIKMLVRGEMRLVVEREIADVERPYRQALVRLHEDVSVDEEAPEVLEVRHELLDLADDLVGEMGELSPFDRNDLAMFTGQTPFESMINGLAALLDLPAQRKIHLLESSLPERAREVLSILRHRRRLLDLLRPFRPLAENPGHN